MKTAALQIRTPEGIVFSQLLAGPVTRFLAWFIDVVCISALLMLLGRVLMLLQILSPDFAAALYSLGYFLLSIGYGIAFEWSWRGQTIGKKLLRLRVVDAEGLRLQFNQIVTRYGIEFSYVDTSDPENVRHAIRPNTKLAKEAVKTGPSFVPYSAAEMREMLQHEFDSRFEVSTTRHYLIVHPRGQRDEWADRLFETFHRAAG